MVVRIVAAGMPPDFGAKVVKFCGSDARFASEFEPQAQVDGEVLHVLSGNGLAVGEPPDAVDAQQAEDVLHAEAHLDIGFFDRGHARRKEQIGFGVAKTAVVAVRKRAPYGLAYHYFAPFEPFHERDAAQQPAVEVVFEEDRRPGIGGEFVEIHAGKGIRIVKVGSVALVQFEHQVGNLAEDLAAPECDVRIADRRYFGLVVQAAFEAVIFVVVAHQAANSCGKPQREDRVLRTEVLRVECRAVDLFVVREAHAYVYLGTCERIEEGAVGPNERHVAVAVDALNPHAEVAAHAVRPFVLVGGDGTVDHRHALTSAAREDRTEDVVFGQGILTGAQLHHVVTAREGQFARQAAAEGQFDASAALHVLVARTVGHIARKTDAAADCRGSAGSRLHAEPFELVEARHLVVGADADVFRIPVAADDGIDERVDVAVERNLLHRIDHGVDIPLAVAEPVGPHLLPVAFVLAGDLFAAEHHVVVHAQDFVGDRFADAHVRVGDLARADERSHLGGVAHDDREFGRNAVAAAEPAGVVDHPVFVLDAQVLDPVYVDTFGHARRSRLQRIGRRVDVDLAVEHRRGHALGMEPDFVGLAPLDREAVHQKIVVEGASAVGERAGETHVEQLDEVAVEIDLVLEIARELGDRKTVVDARYAAGADHLAREVRSAAVVVVGRRFGDHRRQIGLTGERRGVDVVENEAEIALEPLAAKLRLDVRQIELHLGVGGAAVAFVFGGVVARLVADDSVENRMRRVCAGGDDHVADAELDRFECEIHLVERIARDRFGLGSIPDHRGGDQRRRVACFERIDALLVGRDAGRGSGKYHADERQRLPVGGVGHASAHPGTLRRGSCGPEQAEKNEYVGAPLHCQAPKVTKINRN